jgi:hypothetical protein
MRSSDVQGQPHRHNLRLAVPSFDHAQTHTFTYTHHNRIYLDAQTTSHESARFASALPHTDHTPVPRGALIHAPTLRSGADRDPASVTHERAGTLGLARIPIGYIRCALPPRCATPALWRACSLALAAHPAPRCSSSLSAWHDTRTRTCTYTCCQSDAGHLLLG